MLDPTPLILGSVVVFMIMSIILLVSIPLWGTSLCDWHLKQYRDDISSRKQILWAKSVGWLLVGGFTTLSCILVINDSSIAAAQRVLTAIFYLLCIILLAVPQIRNVVMSRIGLNPARYLHIFAAAHLIAIDLPHIIPNLFHDFFPPPLDIPEDDGTGQSGIYSIMGSAGAPIKQLVTLFQETWAGGVLNTMGMGILYGVVALLGAGWLTSRRGRALIERLGFIQHPRPRSWVDF